MKMAKVEAYSFVYRMANKICFQTFLFQLLSPLALSDGGFLIILSVNNEFLHCVRKYDVWLTCVLITLTNYIVGRYPLLAVCRTVGLFSSCLSFYDLVVVKLTKLTKLTGRYRTNGCSCGDFSNGVQMPNLFFIHRWVYAPKRTLKKHPHWCI